MSRVNHNRLKVQAVLNKKRLITDINKRNLRGGIDTEGARITPSYALNYAMFKETLPSYMVPARGTPDLYLTGAFHRSITLKVGNRSYQLVASDKKTKKLTKKYGKILGLHMKSVEEVRFHTQNEFNKLYKHAVNL